MLSDLSAVMIEIMDIPSSAQIRDVGGSSTAATCAWDAVMTLRTASNEGSSNDAEWGSSTSSFNPPSDARMAMET